MKFEIIDNFLEKEDFENIIQTLFPNDLNNPNNFTWDYQKGIVKDPEQGPSGYEEHDWKYCKSLYRIYGDNLRFDKHYHIVKPILKKLEVNKIIDIQANLLVPTKEHIYHDFHIDRSTPHKVALFYVTSSDGWTVLKDTAEVNCIKNRILIFDGSIEHRSVSSTDNIRSAININFLQ